ncbi:MAG: hypothetical protein QXX95_00240 [Nitrososphaerales archaeon]
MPIEGPDEKGFCWPKCVWFKCGKIIKNRPAIQFRQGIIWCNWLNDKCLGPSCAYAICFRNKMMPNNRCGLVVKRVTQDAIKPEDFKLELKVKGRMAKRLGDLDELV